MIKFILLVACFVTSKLLFAQNIMSVGNAISVNECNVFFNTLGTSQPFRNNNTLELETGSYLFKKWHKGYGVGMAKQVVPFAKVNFNLETQTFEIERNNKKEYFSADMLRGFGISLMDSSSTTILFLSLSAPTRNKLYNKKFYQVVVDGKYALLIDYEVVVQSNSYHAALQVGNRARLKVVNTLYVFDGTTVLALKTTKKGVLKKLADKQAQIEEFIAKEQITDFENIDNLKKIFEYYNTL
jgi:hypothetical protein